MNKQQRRILVNFAVVIAVVIAVSVGMYELGKWNNRSEAIRVMKNLGQIVSDYKQKHGSVPPEFYVEGIKKSLGGHVRLGTLHYRAQWIQFDSPPDEILAYVIKDRSIFLGPGAIVLRLDGRVEWMDKVDFDKLPIRQQSVVKTEMAPE
jgi:hypothetical protein